MTQQLNVFVENKPGRFKRVVESLSAAGINIRALAVQDRGDFGVLKLLVDRPADANQALTEANVACALRPVLAVVIADQPGGLLQLTEVLEQAGINVLDAYGFVLESKHEAVWCAEVEKTEAVEALLRAKGFRLLSAQELYDL